MNWEGKNLITSFPWSLDGAPVYIDATHAVVTVISGSSKTGGHASMILEYFNEHNRPVCELVDLGVGSGKSGKISIYRQKGQVILPKKVINDQLPYGGDRQRLRHMHHHSYAISGQEMAALNRAIARFEDKVNNGRYVYRIAGGALGAVFSLPGNRGINCADFIIKVLEEAGIVKFGYKLFDSPHRIAS